MVLIIFCFSESKTMLTQISQSINQSANSLAHSAKVCNTYGIIRLHELSYPDSKVHGANMGPIWGRQDPGGSHVGPMNPAIWDSVPL